MKILFITNLPSPYRVDFFNELGKSVELTVLYERKTASDRDEKWKGTSAVTFTEKYSNDKPVGADKSIGFGLIKEIRKQTFDHLILAGYNSPSMMLAISYCKLKKIPYFIESDGGFNKKDKFPKSILKKFLIKKAAGHFTTCEEYKNYLTSLGVDEKKIYKYPFTSMREDDIETVVPSREEKLALREKLGMTEEKIVLSIGQFIYRKGFDVLMQSATELPKDTGIYIVGGVPTEEYIILKEKLGLDNVYFVGFKTKSELEEYYKAADLFVLPTREDIWGLVINEAMANGLPVITTDRCIAGLELVRNDENGYIVPVGDTKQLAEKIREALSADKNGGMAQKSLDIIQDYTIEKMALSHLDFFKEVQTVGK